MKAKLPIVALALVLSSPAGAAPFEPLEWIESVVQQAGFGSVVQLDTGTFLAGGVSTAGSNLGVSVDVDTGDGSGLTGYGPYFFEVE